LVRERARNAATMLLNACGSQVGKPCGFPGAKVLITHHQSVNARTLIDPIAPVLSII
jgi:hypothetical protein